MKKNKKFILDIIMSVIMVSLMKIAFIGISFHELLGLLVYFLFILHKVFNLSWIKAVSKNLTKKTTASKIKFMYILDALLFINVTYIIISGVMISQFVFNGFNSQNIPFWSEWHHFSAYSALILISVHIGLHWKIIMNMTKKLLGLTGENKMRTVLSRLITVFIVMMGIRSLSKPDVYQNLTTPLVEKDETKISTLTNKSDSAIIPVSNISSSSYTLVAANTPTLEEYLSKLICTGCSRHCPLTALRCSRGTQYKNAAVAKYNSQYSSQTTTQAPSTATPSEDNPSVPPSNETTSSSPAQESTSEATDESSANPLDYIFLMGLFIAGTHYTITIPSAFKK